MERTAVIGDHDGAVRDRRCQLEHIAIMADDGKVAAGRDGLRLLPFSRTGEQRDRVTIGAKRVSQLAVAVVAPMFRRAVQATGMKSEEWPFHIDTRGPE